MYCARVKRLSLYRLTTLRQKVCLWKMKSQRMPVMEMDMWMRHWARKRGRKMGFPMQSCRETSLLESLKVLHSTPALGLMLRHIKMMCHLVLQNMSALPTTYCSCQLAVVGVAVMLLAVALHTHLASLQAE
jgi:hypothetical protein